MEESVEGDRERAAAASVMRAAVAAARGVRPVGDSAAAAGLPVGTAGVVRAAGVRVAVPGVLGVEEAIVGRGRQGRQGPAGGAATAAAGVEAAAGATIRCQ